MAVAKSGSKTRSSSTKSSRSSSTKTSKTSKSSSTRSSSKTGKVRSGGRVNDSARISKDAKSGEAASKNLPDVGSWANSARGASTQKEGAKPLELGDNELLSQNRAARGNVDEGKVRQIQEMINAQGGNLDVDGKYGPKTEAAVREFQKKNGLKMIDGIVGPETQGALNKSMNGDQTKPAGEVKPAGETRPGQTKPGETGQTKPEQTGQTKPGQTGQTKPGETGQTKPGETGQTKPGETGQAKPGENGQTKPQNDSEFSPAAFELIKSAEGFSHPGNWPGEKSGITIGRGYDLGYKTKEQFRQDWGGKLPPEHMKRLESAIGIKGGAAAGIAGRFKDIKIPKQAGEDVFKNVTVPRWHERAKKAFPGMENLPKDAQGALTSLVFNRGDSMKNTDRRREMRSIRDTIKAYKPGTNVQPTLDSVAKDLRSMKRIWAGRKLGGLLKRRDAEAALVQNSGKANPNGITPSNPSNTGNNTGATNTGGTRPVEGPGKLDLGGGTLRKGATGDNVRQLQQMLNTHGAGLETDGKFGPKTQEAVRKFQQDNNFGVDGVVGPETLGGLNGGAQPGQTGQTDTGYQTDTGNKIGATSESPAVATSKQVRGGRNSLKTGTLVLKDPSTGKVVGTYKFNNGGGGRGAIPYGDYEVSGGRRRSDKSSMMSGGFGYSFDLTQQGMPTGMARDPRFSTPRSLLRIHPDGGGAGTIGCIGIVGGREVQEAFYRQAMELQKANGGKFALSFGEG